MEIRTIKTRIFRLNEDLNSFIERYVSSLEERSILVITSKIVALSEGRAVNIASHADKENIIKRESDFVLPTKHVYLTIKDGLVMANAGVDESNADGKLILLPQDSFRTAEKLKKHFQSRYGLKKLGVIITDSRCLPLRAGITGVALGYAGFKGIRDYRGQSDIFRRRFKFSRVDVADSLATAAVVCMGEGDERRPLAVIEEAPVSFANRVNKNELKIDVRDDMYGPIFGYVKKTKRGKR